MESKRWDRMQALFHEVADLPCDARDTFLKAACGDDTTLFIDVMAMLDHDARKASVLDGDVGTIADRVLGGGVPSALADRRFGPYRLTHLLGEGGMGIVCF